jgi:hypothetical protein
LGYVGFCCVNLGCVVLGLVALFRLSRFGLVSETLDCFGYFGLSCVRLVCFNVRLWLFQFRLWSDQVMVRSGQCIVRSRLGNGLGPI